ncbi:sugar ABC transporter substrate-binding protein [Glaesserella sp.]|uniref:ABC transporter substrate-binding protein n=1 Tax=Glaesserella sp. TaxID=2094731 RepID=UPI00359F1BFA
MKKSNKLALFTALSLSNVAFADQITAWVIDAKIEAPFFQQLEQKFNEKYKAENISVQLKAIPSLNDAVQAAWMAKDMPDILFVDGPNMANYTWSGMLKPIDEMLDKEILEQTIPGLISQGTYPPDNKLYMLGMGDSSVLLWGNKKYLEAAGISLPTSVEEAWTYEQFSDVLEKLSKVDGVKWPLDFNVGMAGEWMTYGYFPLVVSNGGNILNAETKRAEGAIDSSATIDAAEKMQAWVKKGYTVPKTAGANRFFSDKTAALAWIGNWMWPTFNESLGEDLVLIPTPKLGAKAFSPNGGWGWAVSSTSKKDNEVAKFLNFALSKDQVKEWAKYTGYIPGRKDAIAETPLFAKGGKLNMLAQQAEQIALVRPIHPAYPVLTKEFGKAMENILNGASPKTELQKAAKNIDRDIEDNDGYPPFDK